MANGDLAATRFSASTSLVWLRDLEHFAKPILMLGCTEKSLDGATLMVHEICLKKISQRENKKKTKIGKESGQEKINIRVEIYGFIVKIFLGEGG